MDAVMAARRVARSPRPMPRNLNPQQFGGERRGSSSRVPQYVGYRPGDRPKPVKMDPVNELTVQERLF